jgi:hypothetical protein
MTRIRLCSDMVNGRCRAQIVINRLAMKPRISRLAMSAV